MQTLKQVNDRDVSRVESADGLRFSKRLVVPSREAITMLGRQVESGLQNFISEGGV